MKNKYIIIVFSLFLLQSSQSFFELSEVYDIAYAGADVSNIKQVGYRIAKENQQAHIRGLVEAYLDTSSDPITSLYNERITRELVRNFFINVSGSEEVTNTILFYAEKENLPIGVVFSLVFVESRFNMNRVNTANKNKTTDLGLFQLNSRTFRHFNPQDFFNLETNVKAGVGYLRYAFNLDPDPKIALAIYNAGPTRPLRGLTPESTKKYVSRILAYSSQLETHFRYYMKKQFMQANNT